MNNKIEATVYFKDMNQFQTFIEKNGIEEYTWKKGKYTIDLSQMLISSVADYSAKTEEKKPDTGMDF